MAAQPTAFTYQGRLADAATPASGNYDFEFVLFDAATEGIQQGTPQTKPNVPVAGGIFTVELDFGAVPFTAGSNQYLEIRVKRITDNTYTTLTPRQRITSVPYAIRSQNAVIAASADGLSASCVNCVTDAQLQGISGSKVEGAVSSATTADTAITANGLSASCVACVTDDQVQGISGSKVQGTVASATIAGSAATANTATSAANAQNLGGVPAANYLTKTGDGSGLTNIPGTFKWTIVSGTLQQAAPNSGYVANDANEVTITLPENPSPGDTVRVAGVGSGGWKIAQNPGQQIQTGQIVPANVTGNQPWNAVASSDDGTRLVAVAYQGQIYTSADSGATWTARDIARTWVSVASSSDGSKLVAVAFSNRIFTSTDFGASWIPRDSVRGWRGVASSADGAKLVAVANGGRIYTSTDSGASWTPRETNRLWYAVASSSDGTKLVAAVRGGQIYTSTDSGLSWTPRETNQPWFALASSSDGTRLAATGVTDGVTIGGLFTSDNSGTSWARISSNSYSGVASSADGMRLVATIDGGKIFIFNHATGAGSFRESDREWSGVASSADGTKLVAVVRDGAIYRSTDSGLTWTPVTRVTTPGTPGGLRGPQHTSVELIYLGGGQFIIVPPIAAGVSAN